MLVPPIFAYVIFFVLDFLAFIFYIFGVTAPIGAFLTSFTTGLYILRTLFKYGPKRTGEKLFKYRNISNKKLAKKLMKVFGSSIIPFLTVWAVHDDYKEDLQIAKGGGDVNATEEERTKKKGNLKKAAVLAGATLATGGAGGAALVGRAATGRAIAKTGVKKVGDAKLASAKAGLVGSGVAQEVSKEILEEEREQRIVEERAQARNEAMLRGKEESLESTEEQREKRKGGEVGGMREINPWMKVSSKRVGREDIKKEKTISEEVGGIKTGLEREDYDENIVNFSKPRTYENLLAEREENRKKEEKKRKEIESNRIIQKKKEEFEQRQVYDRAFIRRFGTAAYERMIRDREMREGQRAKVKEIRIGDKAPKKDKEKEDKYREAA